MARGFVFFKRLDTFEEIEKRRWIVPGTIHVLQTKAVRLGFHSAREFEEAHRDEEARCLPDCIPGPAAHEDQWNAGHVDYFSAGGVLRAMTSGHMRNFMSED